MSSKLNRHSYEKLIAEDIEWLQKQPRTLERDHIIMIVKASPDHEYREDAEPNCPHHPSCNGFPECGHEPLGKDPDDSWDPIGGRPINPDVLAAAAMSDPPRSAPLRTEGPFRRTGNIRRMKLKRRYYFRRDVAAGERRQLLDLAQNAADNRAQSKPMTEENLEKWAASEVEIGMEIDRMTSASLRWVGSVDCKVNPIESRTCERETDGCSVVHGEKDMFYMCVACTKLIVSHGMCRKCSNAWGLGRQHGLTLAADYLIKTLCEPGDAPGLAKEMATKIRDLKG